MTEYASDWPGDFRAFQQSRTRFFDRMAADAVLREVGRDALAHREQTMDPIVVEGQLSILVEERRVVIGYFAPGQRDLADVIRDTLGSDAEAFGVAHAGLVRITVESLSGDAESTEES
jgi:hypothetical protein